MEIGIKSYILHKDGLRNGLFLLVILAIGFTVVQDLIHAGLNHYRFYLSESLLFKSFWLLFLPLLMGQFRLLKAYPLLAKHRMPLLITLAIGLPTLLHLFLFPVVVWLLSFLFFDHTYTIQHTLSYTLGEDLYKYIIIYGLGTLYSVYRSGPQQPAAKAGPFLQKISVNIGRSYVNIPINDVLYIATAAPYLAISTAQKQYLHSNTLKSMDQQLDPKQFVRIHRSAIVNINKVVSYKSRLNGDYDLLLNNNETLRLSRNYVPAFRKAMQ